MIRMPGFLFILLIANSMIPILSLSDRSIAEGKHRKLIVCNLPSGITVNITFTMQTYYQLQCPLTEYDAVGAFLYDYFQRYSAFDQALGPLALVPTTQKLCTTSQARRLNNANTNALIGSKERKLQGASTGYIWRAPAICRLCTPDNRDGRRLAERQLQLSSLTTSTSSMTSPVTIVVKTDAYPMETSYRLRTITSNRDILISPMFTAPETVYTQTVYLEPGKDYRLTMRDAFGDGICCYYGPGYVQINAGTSIRGPIIAAERGDYGLTRTLYFTVPTSMPPTTINLPLMELRYSDYLTYYVQQFFHFNSLSCLYGSNPTISVKLLQLPQNASVPTSCH
jgi:hypothetical protein